MTTGHPMADAPLMYILAIAPCIGFSALAVGLGLIADRDPGKARRWAVAGIVVGLVAAVLSLTGIPGHLMADHWIEPLPDERR